HRRRCQQRAAAASAARDAAFWEAAAVLEGAARGGELPRGVELEEVLASLSLAPDLAVALGLDWALPASASASSGAAGGRGGGGGVGGGGAVPPLSSPGALAGASEQELRAELARRVGERTQERVMSGDPWVADPCGMGLPGYRTRYYTSRFPELAGGGGGGGGGDVDRVAARVVRAYMD
ncbi:hypothetical protein Agub_g12226, partial [Astrephomene gubernaculifera]